MTTQRPIGDRIRKLRLAQGLTQAELGEQIGVSQRMVAYYERRGVSPAPELLLKMARVLGASVEDLVGTSASKEKKTASLAQPSGKSETVYLWRRLKKLEDLPAQDRKSVLKMIDALSEQAARRKVS